MPFPVHLQARSTFSAARRLASVRAGHPCASLHGHDFRATVTVAAGAAAELAADAVRRVHERVDAALAPLCHADLNALLPEPDDAALVQWIGERTALPGMQRVALTGGPDRGAVRGADGTLHFWRRFRFESAHQLPRVPPGHKCGRMHGHGFAAVLTVRAGAGETAHAAYDRMDLAWAPLHDLLHYRCLNDLPGLDNPTSEQLAAWLWQRLEAQLQGLGRIAVFETASCGATYDGGHYGIWKDFTVDSAALSPAAPAGSPEARLHGHTYLVRLLLRAPLDAVLGWTVDFGDVKTAFDPVFRRLDHHPLHELGELRDAATAPGLADWISRTLRPRLAPLAGVQVIETAGCGAVRVDDAAVLADIPD